MKTIFAWAISGEPEAQCELGKIYFDGRYVQQDYLKAAQWYTKAANQGNAEAQLRLGDMYSLGLGVKPDYEEAFGWYTYAATSMYEDARDRATNNIAVLLGTKLNPDRLGDRTQRDERYLVVKYCAVCGR